MPNNFPGLPCWILGRQNSHNTDPAAIAPPLSILQNPDKMAVLAVLPGFWDIESGGAMAAGSVASALTLEATTYTSSSFT